MNKKYLDQSSPTMKFSISGLRGVVPKDLNPLNLPAMAAAFSASLGKGSIAVARDARSTGGAIRHLLLGTLASCGRDVIDLGLVSTPTIKAYVHRHKLAGGIMISASHNPAEYNAFKFIAAGGDFFSAKENDRFVSNLEKSNFPFRDYRKQGTIRIEHKATLEHMKQAAQVILPGGWRAKKKIHAVFDPVGSCAISMLEHWKLFPGLKVSSIHSELSPKFPRPPEPVPSALGKLKKAVREHKADIGFAFDPDADRLAIVSGSGKAVGEEVTLPLAMMGALEYRQGPVVVNLSSSWLNEAVAAQYGRNCYRSAVGEANVVRTMRQKKAAFGGEGNGGVIDPKVDSFGRDTVSGVFWILYLMGKTGKSLDELVSELPKVKMKKTKYSMNPKDLGSKLRELRKEFSEFHANTTDGLRLSDHDGLPWIHVRASNTEPIVRVILEAHTSKELKSIENRLGHIF